MERRLLSGDEAVAAAARDGGIHLGTGCPGTPSTGILEAFSRRGRALSPRKAEGTAGLPARRAALPERLRQVNEKAFQIGRDTVRWQPSAVTRALPEEEP